MAICDKCLDRDKCSTCANEDIRRAEYEAIYPNGDKYDYAEWLKETEDDGIKSTGQTIEYPRCRIF